MPEFWEKYFKTYDVLNEVVPYQQLIDRIIQEARITDGMTVLDAGVGTGNVPIQMKKAYTHIRIIGIDTAQEGLDRWKTKDAHAESFVHNIQNILPFERNFFDVVVSNNALYTISRDKRTQVVKEFYRVIKPGGTIVIANLKKGFSPFAIYTAHVKTELREKGFIQTTAKIIRMLPETLKMFYYNALIQKEHAFGKFDFFEKGEQRQLLHTAGFQTGDEISVYAHQGLLVVGTK